MAIFDEIKTMTQEQVPAAVSSIDARLSRLTLGIAGLAAMVTYLDTTILFVAFPDPKQRNDYGP